MKRQSRFRKLLLPFGSGTVNDYTVTINIKIMTLDGKDLLYSFEIGSDSDIFVTTKNMKKKIGTKAELTQAIPLSLDYEVRKIKARDLKAGSTLVPNFYGMEYATLEVVSVDKSSTKSKHELVNVDEHSLFMYTPHHKVDSKSRFKYIKL